MGNISVPAAVLHYIKIMELYLFRPRDGFGRHAEVGLYPMHVSSSVGVVQAVPFYHVSESPFIAEISVF